MGRIFIADGKMLFEWGRLCSDADSLVPGEFSFQPRGNGRILLRVKCCASIP